MTAPTAPSRPPRLVLRFALYSALALLVAGIAILWVVRHEAQASAEQELTQDARRAAAALGAQVQATDVERPIADAARLTALDDLFAPERKEGVVRVKLWRPDGTITYSTDRSLIGDRVEGDELAEVLAGESVREVGHLNDGWTVANATLFHERNMLSSTTRTQMLFDGLVRRARKTRRNGKPATDDPVVRQRLADLAIQVETRRLEAYRQLTETLRGHPAGIAASVNKLTTCELNHQIGRAALEILGPSGWLHRADPDAVDGGLWPLDYMFALGLIIGGGTAQVQKNIIAERGLGLPKEPRPA